MVRTTVVGLVLVGAVAWSGVSEAATVLCAKKSGALFARDTQCKKKETAVTADPTAILGNLPTRVSTLESGAATLQSAITTLQAGALTKSSPGTVAGYATVASDGTLAEHYSSTGGTVTSSRVQAGEYSVAFGFQVRPNQPIVAVPRETFGHEICRVFDGAAPVSTVSVFCANADPGSPAADVAFTLVVFN